MTKSKYFIFLYLIIFILVLSTCKKDNDETFPKISSYCFWTDKKGYPIDVSIIERNGGHDNVIPIGTITNYTDTPITNFNASKTLIKTLQFERSKVVEYYARLKPPFYFSINDWYGSVGYTWNSWNFTKIERDTTLVKVTFWTNNPSYVQNNNYLDVRIWNRFAGKICKLFSNVPNCGTDSTFNTLIAANTTFSYSVYLNYSTLIYSGSYTVNNSDSCSTILIP